jgi:hypothetical protein
MVDGVIDAGAPLSLLTAALSDVTSSRKQPQDNNRTSEMMIAWSLAFNHHW